MIFYEGDVRKSVSKGLIPKGVFERIHNAFVVVDASGDFGLFDIKKMKSSGRRDYFRLRKGKYRAIFYVENGNCFVIALAKREDVYHAWE